MNLRDLRYLVALADHKHFGRAAVASFVSQPTLSTQLKKFEDEIGMALVERNPRNVMLTEVGEAVVVRARVILREADEIKAIARRAKDPESGAVRIGIFPTLGPYLLPHVVPNIVARFPKLELILVEEKTEVLLKKLHEGELDAAILALPIHDDSLHAEFLFEEAFVLALRSHEVRRCAFGISARGHVRLLHLEERSEIDDGRERFTLLRQRRWRERRDDDPASRERRRIEGHERGASHGRGP